MLVERKEGIVGPPFKRITSCIDFRAWSAEYGRAFSWWEAELLGSTLHGALPRTAT
jgi:hypothetical protein